ncbi:4-oxalocrotonate tautomerase family protein [Streptomyces sp. S1D4-11]
MPIVTIQQGPRDVELKRDLVKRVTDAFVDAYKIPAESVHVWIHEVLKRTVGAAREADRRQVEGKSGEESGG